MLVLFETPAGYAVFKLLDEKKLLSVDNLYKDFETPEKANNVVKLKDFRKFEDTTEALSAATAAVEGKMSKPLKKLLKKLASKELHEELAVSDAKLGNLIKEKMDINCVSNSAIHELMRGIRGQMNNLITGLSEREVSAMALGLAHSLSRYKLKFSPDKVDTMIVQAISLLDDLDKELNNYIMRCREWYGWHFPEMGKIVTDNLAYSRTVRAIGMRTNASSSDLSKILPEEVEEELKVASEISMGTDVSEEDIENIFYLCDQIIEISNYRAQLYDYLKNRMQAIAPNLSVLVGELVGARLIAHAGSLLNLAKHPASTVQILGAEKALFRALKTKHDTPKYGLIYHASLVGGSQAKLKGKVSRMLASKCALAIRYDALGEDVTSEVGIKQRAELEARIRDLESEKLHRISGQGKSKKKFEKYMNTSDAKSYNPSTDSTIGVATPKRKLKEEVTEKPEDEETEEPTPKKAKKDKKHKREEAGGEDGTQDDVEAENDIEEGGQVEEDQGLDKKKKKKKKKKIKQEAEE